MLLDFLASLSLCGKTFLVAACVYIASEFVLETVVLSGTQTERSKSEEKHSHDDSSLGSISVNRNKKNRKGMMIEGYSIEGMSIAGHETCIILPTLNLAFDNGQCRARAISQQFLFISHGRMDHILFINEMATKTKSSKSEEKHSHDDSFNFGEQQQEEWEGNDDTGATQLRVCQ